MNTIKFKKGDLVERIADYHQGMDIGDQGIVTFGGYLTVDLILTKTNKESNGHSPSKLKLVKTKLETYEIY